MKLTSVQQAQITKYALANGNYHYRKLIFAHGISMRSGLTRRAEN